jgi:hypothetical protein
VGDTGSVQAPGGNASLDWGAPRRGRPPRSYRFESDLDGSEVTSWYPRSAHDICTQLNLDRSAEYRIREPKYAAVSRRLCTSIRSFRAQWWRPPLCWYFAAVTRFLDPVTIAILCEVEPRYDPAYGDSWLYPPGCPIRRRVYGCGRASPVIEAKHHQPSGFVLIHWAWAFLSVAERRLLGEEVSVVFRAYG